MLVPKHKWRRAGRILALCLAMIGLGIIGMIAGRSVALVGDVNMHDPSTVVSCEGRYWVYATGRGISVHSSADGITWRREPPILTTLPAPVAAAVPLNKGAGIWAPDVVFVNGQYCLYYAVSSWGSNVSAVALLTSPTLNPENPRYHWTDRGVVVNSVTGENLNAIDPSVLHAPNGTMWLTYGSYIGSIQMVELDPKTGQRLSPHSPAFVLSTHSEASALIAHNDYYYLFVNHGSCCNGKNSTYHICVGRSHTVTGPYLDRYGVDMLQGGGSTFLAANDGKIGPGHFGLVTMDGLERFSCHYEADTAHGGRSALDIRPLLWTADGWPEAGDGAQNGTYQIVSKRRATALEISAPAANAPASLRLVQYMTLDNQKWTLTAAAGGYFTIANGGMALTAVPGPAGPSLTLAAPATDDNQLWAVDERSDGSFRILAKTTRLALSAVSRPGTGAQGPGLATYAGDDTQAWLLAAP